MIRMIYDPIFGARYIIDDTDPRTESKNIFIKNLQEKYCRTCSATRAKAARKNNTKSK